jgi:hypothetical protein
VPVPLLNHSMDRCRQTASACTPPVAEPTSRPRKKVHTPSRAVIIVGNRHRIAARPALNYRNH